MKLIIETTEACAAISLWVKERYGIDCDVQIFPDSNSKDGIEVVGITTEKETEGEY